MRNCDPDYGNVGSGLQEKLNPDPREKSDTYNEKLRIRILTMRYCESGSGEMRIQIQPHKNALPLWTIRNCESGAGLKETANNPDPDYEKKFNPDPYYDSIRMRTVRKIESGSRL